MGAKVTGFEKGSEFNRWIKKVANTSDIKTLLDEIGRAAQKETIRYIKDDKVTPTVSEMTLKLRRGRKKSPSGSGTTLLDKGLGWRTVNYHVNGIISVEVGVPDGYMWRHQKGKGVPQRKFLQWPSKTNIKKLINAYWTTR